MQGDDLPGGDRTADPGPCHRLGPAGPLPPTGPECWVNCCRRLLLGVSRSERSSPARRPGPPRRVHRPNPISSAKALGQQEQRKENDVIGHICPINLRSVDPSHPVGTEPLRPGRNRVPEAGDCFSVVNGSSVLCARLVVASSRLSVLLRHGCFRRELCAARMRVLRSRTGRRLAGHWRPSIIRRRLRSTLASRQVQAEHEDPQHGRQDDVQPH